VITQVPKFRFSTSRQLEHWLLNTTALLASNPEVAVKFSDVIPCLQWSTNKLPAGDAHRVWFPEMVATLRSAWDEAMPLPELVRLCDDLNGMRQQIRHERQILPPVIHCRSCGRTGRAAEPRVGVRAVILAAARFGPASPTIAKRLEREWAKYRAQNGLDLYGHVAQTVRELRDCPHTTP
jgi:hypothetical protein